MSDQLLLFIAKYMQDNEGVVPSSLNNFIDAKNFENVRASDTGTQKMPIHARLDRVFNFADWKTCFPVASLYTLPRSTSDHAPCV